MQTLTTTETNPNFTASNVIALPTAYKPAESQETPEVDAWLWWFEHVRARIDAEFLFPCRVGDKPGFLCDFDMDDRNHMFMVRVALAAAIPEHASNVVFVRVGRPEAKEAITIGLEQLYAEAS
jgi:hypothetical protein